MALSLVTCSTLLATLAIGLSLAACSALVGIGDLPFPVDAGDGGAEQGDEGERADGASNLVPEGGAPGAVDAADANENPEASPTTDASGSEADGLLDAPPTPEASAPEASMQGEASSPEASAPEGGGTEPACLDAGAVAANFVQTAGGNTSATAQGMDITAPVAMPESVGAGDWIVVAAEFSVPTLPQISDTLGSSFVLAAGPSGDVYGNLTAIWYAENVAGGSDTVNVRYGSAPDGAYLEVIAVEYRGLAAMDQKASGWGTNVDGDLTIQTSAPNELIFGYFTVNGSSTGGCGFTVRSAFDGDVIEDELAGQPGTYHVTGVLDGDEWIIIAASFKTE